MIEWHKLNAPGFDSHLANLLSGDNLGKSFNLDQPNIFICEYKWYLPWVLKFDSELACITCYTIVESLKSQLLLLKWEKT